MATKKSVNDWAVLFKAADKNDSGCLDITELRDLLRNGNCKITDSQIADVFVYFDGPNGDKNITLEEFTEGMKKLEAFIEKVNELFKQYDADNSGYLDKAELRKLLESCGQNFTEGEISSILKDADRSGDGKISFQEFIDACS